MAQSESSPGKKDPALHPVVPSSGNSGRNSLSAAVTAVANAPPITQHRFSSGQVLS